MAMIDATIVSTFQRDIIHKIPGVYPGDYVLPAAQPNDFTVTHIPPSCFYIDSGQDTPMFPVPQDPSVVAKSIINDINRAYIEVGPDRGPGIFMIDGWIEGEGPISTKEINVYKEQIKKTHAPQLESARKKQENWARQLVKIADNDWNKWKSHRAISDLHIWASGYLGLNREYTNLENIQASMECPACGINIRPNVPVCFNCKAVLDLEKAKKFGLA